MCTNFSFHRPFLRDFHLCCKSNQQFQRVVFYKNCADCDFKKESDRILIDKKPNFCSQASGQVI